MCCNLLKLIALKFDFVLSAPFCGYIDIERRNRRSDTELNPLNKIKRVQRHQYSMFNVGRSMFDACPPLADSIFFWAVI